MNKNMTVLLLAGGKSTRFWPFGNKMSLKFLNKSLISYQIELLHKAGFKNCLVVASSELKESIDSRIVTVIEQKGEGMGAAVLSAAQYIADQPLLIVVADDLVDISLFKQLTKVIDSSQHILVGYKTTRYFPGGYLEFEGKRIARIHEKPGAGNVPSNYVYMGSNYITNGSLLLDNLEKVKNTDPLRVYEQALSEMMATGQHFEMLEYQGTWIPLKYPWQVLDLMKYFLSTISPHMISKSAVVHKTAILTGPVVLEEGVRVLEYAKLVGPLYIGKNAIIGNHTMLRESMIGAECVIGFNSDVARSFIGNNCWFHSNYVGDSVIGDDVAMGAGAVLANLRLDEGTIYSVVKGERVTTSRIKLGAVIGRGSRIGIEAQLMPGVKVGRQSLVGPGVILQDDLPDNKKCFLKQDLQITDYLTSEKPDRLQYRMQLK